MEIDNQKQKYKAKYMSIDKKMKEKIEFLNEMLGFNIYDDYLKRINQYKQQFSLINEKTLNMMEEEYINKFLTAIKNPECYKISSYQRDNRSKIQVIKDILIGHFFEDCFLYVFNEITNKKCYLNYERFKVDSYTNDEDFIIRTKKNNYLVEFKTLSFKRYTKVPIKEANVIGHEESFVFLMNKDTNDIFIIKNKDLTLKKAILYKKWNKKCFMLNKKGLKLKFNINNKESILKIAKLFI